MQRLKELKQEIDHLQHFINKTKRQVQRDYEAYSAAAKGPPPTLGILSHP